MLIPLAVGRGGDLVREIHTALAWKPSGEINVITVGRKPVDGVLDALADALAVGGGPCQAIKRPDPTAACVWHCTAVCHVGNAWHQVPYHLAARYGCLDTLRCAQYCACDYHQAKNSHFKELRACHYDILLFLELKIL